jgi:hypothetical protein
LAKERVLTVGIDFTLIWRVRQEQALMVLKITQTSRLFNCYQ